MIANLAVLSFGSLSFDYNEHLRGAHYKLKKDIGISGDSSVTLVQTDDMTNILIDTGFRNEGDTSGQNLLQNKTELLHKLRMKNLTAEQIHEIFITHWHHDHFGNFAIFPHAKIITAGIKHDDLMQLAKFYQISQNSLLLNEGDQWRYYL